MRDDSIGYEGLLLPGQCVGRQQAAGRQAGAVIIEDPSGCRRQGITRVNDAARLTCDGRRYAAHS